MAAVRIAVDDDGRVGRRGDRGRRLLRRRPAAWLRWSANCSAQDVGSLADLALAEQHFAGSQPIDDVRGSADYRRGAAREIVSRALAATAATIVGQAKPAKECAA